MCFALIFHKIIWSEVIKLIYLYLTNTLVLPTFLYGSENWTLTASQRRRIEATEMKLLRPLAGYTLYDHKTRQMNTDWTGFNTCKECHKTESLLNHTTTDHKEGEQLEDRRNVGESSCNFGDGTDQSVQSLMCIMMMMMMMMTFHLGSTIGAAFRTARARYNPHIFSA